MSRKARILELMSRSSLDLCFGKDELGPVWFMLRVHGALAKLPSTTNNRLIRIPKEGLLAKVRTLRMNLRGLSVGNLHELERDVQKLRALITKNPAHLEQLEALSNLYRARLAGREFSFPVDAKNRAVVLMLLSPALNRHDSHNIPKAVCDWLQEEKILANDRYVDVVSLRKTDLGIKSESSDVMVVRGSCYQKAMRDLINPMLAVIERMENRDVEATTGDVRVVRPVAA